MKYDDVPDSLYQMYENLKGKYFPHLANAKVLFLINKKKMMQRGNIVLGKIVKPNDLVRYLSRNEAPEDGYDYIILFDRNLMQHCEESDIERVLRHELRHAFFDAESKSPYKLVDHDFSDFYDEVELNKDDPTWAKRVSQTVSLIYHQEKDEK
jgi:predicted SprT family Zn-dependent metalloprotease